MAMLTRSSWVKIILIALFCLVLCCGIIGCSMGCTSAFYHFGNIANMTYEGVSYSEQGDFSVDGQEVKSIEITWLAGSVDLVIEKAPDGNPVYDEDDVLPITGVEESRGNLRDGERMTWQLQNGVLQISYGPVRWGVSSCSNAGAKHLVLTIPEGIAARSFDSVTLTAASGEYNLGQFGCQNLNIDLASGLVQGDGVDAKNLDLDVASGNVNLRGDFLNSVSMDVASGLVSVASLSSCPQYTSIDVMSGQASLAIPDDSGFSAKVDKLSGSFNCDFKGAWDAQTDGLLVCGDGKKTMDISMASGTVILAKSE